MKLEAFLPTLCSDFLANLALFRAFFVIRKLPRFWFFDKPPASLITLTPPSEGELVENASIRITGVRYVYMSEGMLIFETGL